MSLVMQPVTALNGMTYTASLNDVLHDVLQVMYNRAAQFWHALFTMFSQYKLIRGREWMHFFGSQQRFFRQMLMAAKVGISDPALCCAACIDCFAWPFFVWVHPVGACQ